MEIMEIEIEGIVESLEETSKLFSGKTFHVKNL
jgi:hypothetical protein